MYKCNKSLLERKLCEERQHEVAFFSREKANGKRNLADVIKDLEMG